MLTFLFTDLESSTRLWEEHPHEMRDALARHDAILRDAVQQANGTVVKTTGDGLLAVFSSVGDAVAASVAAQKGLGAWAWGSTGPLRVRMGIHVGEAQYRDGDYYGTAVNRAARIMAVGHGGQVLVSRLAAEVAGDLPESAGLRDLGMHRLKDLTQPEHLFQLLHPDLFSDFAPLAGVDARPNNLPTQVSEFFGREAELAVVRGMLEDPSIRLITLAGPGGTGKTRLGLQVAAEEVDRFPDGAFFVDLAAERHPDAAFEAVVRELGLEGTREERPLDVLKRELRDRQMLLVLDNFEQVTEAASGVAELLHHCRDLVALVTSREVLRVRGEHVFPVPPLALAEPGDPPPLIARSEAVRLFAERARSVLPDFVVTEENASAIAEICARLDGLPLAIELAAARLRMFSPNDLRDRLRGRLDVLGRGARDVTARQQTLRGAIEWSYDLLDEDERRVLELMSVFAGARFEAVEEVSASVWGDVDALDVLASLVDKSLVRSAESRGSQRFSMLQTIGEYASERLAEAPERATEIRRTHAEYYSRYAQGLRRLLEGPDWERALEDLASEIGNLRAAWRHWVDESNLEQLYLLLDGLWALHDARGWYHSAIELTTDLLSVLSTSPPSPERAAEEITLRTSLARALMAVRGYTVEVEQAFRHVLDLTEAAGEGAQSFPVLRALGAHYMNIADMAQSNAMGRRLLELGARENDESILIEGHFVFGATTAFLGDLETGLSHLDEAIRMYDASTRSPGRFRLGSVPGVVSRSAAALLRWQSGALERAVAERAETLRLARESNHPFSLAYALYHMGYLALDRRDYQGAAQCAEELASVAIEHDYSIWQALASVLGGVATCGLGRVDEGLAMSEAGIELYRGLTTPPVFWPLVLGLRATAFKIAGRPDRALPLTEEAISTAESQGVPFPELRVLRGDVIRLVPGGDVEEAAGSYLAAIEASRALGLRLFELRARVGLAELQSAAGGNPDFEGLRALYDTFTEGLDSSELAAARAVLERA